MIEIPAVLVTYLYKTTDPWKYINQYQKQTFNVSNSNTILMSFYQGGVQV